MKAYELIDSPEKWCTGLYYNRKGQMCVVGAIATAYGLDYEIIEGYNEYFLKKLEKFLKGDNITVWNDSSTWEEVYNALKICDI